LLGVVAANPSDTFLEIGPGHGALTRALAAHVTTVVAFEIDRDLAQLLREDAIPNVTIVEGDFLDVTRASIVAATGGPGVLRAAGNLPYNVASPILFKLLDLYASNLPLVDATVMLQREVADRLLAAPGGGDYGPLAVVLGRWAHLQRLLALPPGAFRPAPKVHSAVVRLRFRAPQPAVLDERTFRNLVRAVFTRRRKTLSNALLAYTPAIALPPKVALARAGLDGTRRPENLSIDEFARLADVFARESLTGHGPAVV
jgi:16S rRNA (adenine1518-N6/adenine1519-N6)-dimethyltransferase